MLATLTIGGNDLLHTHGDGAEATPATHGGRAGA